MVRIMLKIMTMMMIMKVMMMMMRRRMTTRMIMKMLIMMMIFFEFATVTQHHHCVPIDINPFITHPPIKGCTTKPGSTPPTLYELSVGSFTSHKNQNSERAVRRDLQFGVLIRKD